MTDAVRQNLQSTLGNAYTLERELGGGGMSRVFVAEETALRRKVVVKLLPPDLIADVNLERFNREILLAAGLQHPHIVPVLSAGEMDGVPYYTMPLVEGESLRARLAQHGALSIVATIGVLRDVAKALAYAHDHGVVHRDIKPDNVLLNGGSATVTDFGIAKAITVSRTQPGQPLLTQAGTSLGTPAYMSPEQASGDPTTDHRADIYSFGCMAYELLTGRPPFVEQSPRKLLAAQMTAQPVAVDTLRPETPGELAELVMRCLAKEPEDRPQRASDVVHVLESATSGASHSSLGRSDGSALRRALSIYVAAFVVVVALAKAAIVGIGLPDWVLPGSIVVMAAGLPVILLTGYVQRVAHQVLTATPTFTPGGSNLAHGSMAAIAIKASPHLSWRRTTRGGVLALTAFIVIVAAFMVLRSAGIGPFGSLVASGALKAKEPILLTDFAVNSGDSALGRVVSDAVRAGLNESSVITLVPPAQIAAASQRMRRSMDARLDLATARQMAEREGIKAIVDGEVTQLGSSFVVAVRLVTADSGRELVSYHAPANDAQSLINAADELARKLRSKAGESLRSVQNTMPLSRATTSSLEALRKYSAGSRANVSRDYPGAIRLFREAVEIDPTFASAWRSLGVSMNNLQLPRAAVDSALQRAYDLRARLRESEADLVEANYYNYGPGRDRAKAAATYERVLARGDSGALNNLALLTRTRRQYARAETLYRAAVTRFPDGQLAQYNLAFNYQISGKFREADSAYAAVLARFPTSQGVRQQLVLNQRLRGDLDSYARSLDSARAVNSGATERAWELRGRSDLAMFRGRLKEADEFLKLAQATDSSVGRRVTPVTVATEQLLTLTTRRLPAEAGTRVLDNALLRAPLNRQPEAERPFYAVAQAYASAGRVDKAKQILAQSESDLRDTSLKRAMNPDRHRANAAIAAAEKRWRDAIDERRKADSLPDGPVDLWPHLLPLDLMHFFAEAGMADSALAQYAAYAATPIGRRPLSGPDVLLGAEGYETLAQLYEKKGEPAKAADAYRIMIELWKNADPILQPRVAEARRRISALLRLEEPRRR